MWSIFHCLSLGALVMSHGREDYLLPKWNKEIVHFDLKQENCQLSNVSPGSLTGVEILTGFIVLIGAPITDAEHLDNPPIKVL